MNATKLYELLQDCEETMPHFFATESAHHARVDVRYFTGAFFSAHCENVEGLRTLLRTLLDAYRTQWTENHPTDVKIAWVYADES